MLSWREKNLQRSLKDHDYKLFLKKANGIVHVMREAYRLAPIDVDGVMIKFSVRDDFYIISLTDNWRMDGTPVEWGSLPVLKRMRDIDAQNPNSMIHRMEENNRKVDESKQRDLARKTEDAVREWRPIFKEATKDINTSSLEKIDGRRKRERKIEAKLKLKG